MIYIFFSVKNRIIYDNDDSLEMLFSNEKNNIKHKCHENKQKPLLDLVRLYFELYLNCKRFLRYL